MAVSTSNAFSGPYTANGTTTTFPFTFAAMAATDVAVLLRNADGIDAVVDPASYTVSLTGSAPSAGSVVFGTAPASGNQVFVYLEPAFDQPASFSDGSAWKAAAVNNVNDRAALRDQALRRDLERSLRVPLGEEGLPIASLSSADGKVLGVVGGVITPIANDVVAAADYADAAAQSAEDANTAKELASAERAAAEVAQTGAQAAQAAAEQAEAAANAAVVAAQDYFPGARLHVPQGAVTGAGTISTAGTGGTNGTFDLAFSGGNFAVNPTGTFTVSGGAVTAITITGAGLYIGNAISNPTLSFAASAGLTGAAGTFNTVYLKTAGQYWLTDTSPASGYLSLFQNQANAAVEIDAQFDPMSAGSAAASAAAAAASAAAAADAATQLSSDFLNDGLAFAVVDDYGFAMMTVDTAGQMIATTIAVQTVATAELTPTGPDLTIAGDGIAIVDDYGFVVARIDPDGVETATSAATPVVPQNDYARHIVGVYGQSLSSGTAARPPISTAQRYGNKMLSTGVRVNGLADATINAATLADLIESDSGTEGETPVSGHCDAVLQLLDAENAAGWPTHQFRLLGFDPGKPATAIAGLSKTTTPYNTAKTALARLVALSPDDPVVHLAMDWVQGESDIQNGTARATYKTALKTLRTDWEADAQAITGQAEGVKLLSYQGCSHSAYNVATPDIALAQIDAATEDANIVIVTPDYIFRRADNVHLIAADSWLMGAYFGAAYKRIFLDGGTWETVRPVSKTIRGASCDVRFRVPHGPLVFDTSAVTNPGNYGFKMVDSGGSALTITAVTLMGPDWVRITCSGTIPTGSKVRYAWGTFSGVTAAGPSTGPRGNLRDSAGGALKVTDPTGLVRPLHNWCELFEI